MKRIKKLLVGLVFIGTTRSYGQSAATTSVTVSIIAPITIVKTVDMNFGNIAISTSLPGTVSLSPEGSRITGGAGGATLPANTGVVSAASFNVLGQSGYTYAITLPSSVTILDAASHTMIVNTFISAPSLIGTLGPGGTQVLNVGATLNAMAGQAVGVYTNATLVPVTVNYN